MNLSVAALLFSIVSVIPPLTPEQRATFDQIIDHKMEVEDGFYSLLTNASQWPVDDEPTGQGLNIDATFASPAEYRGLPFLIEGEYLGLQEVYMVRRSGPWDGKLEQWGIRVPGSDLPVMVFLTNPPPVPVQGQKVRLTGRFYKVWPVQDERTGRKLEYLVFVGHSARVAAGLTLPPLTETDRRGLSAVVDYTGEIDHGPFYQLINNAMLWKDVPMPASPLITHSDPIIGAPAEYRGLPLRVEGILARRQDFKASRGGSWKKIEQWVIEVAPKTKEKPGESVIVYLVDPPDAIKVEDRVRVIGRFYKVWRTYQAHGETNVPYNFVVLVGQGAELIDKPVASIASGGATTGTPITGQVVRMAASVLLLLGLGFFMVKRYVKRVGASGGPGGEGLRAILEKRKQEREARAHDTTSPGETSDEVLGPPLPADPAEALLEMERRSKPHPEG